MLLQYTDLRTGALFAFTDDLKENRLDFLKQDNLLKLVWNRNEAPISFQVDDRLIVLQSNEILAITFVNHLVMHTLCSSLTTFAFNREFYCMQDHDKEVSCYGILFFGAQHLPIVRIPPEEMPRYEMMYQIFIEEFQNNDYIQGEMLQILLKRLIIKCTRLAQKQSYFDKLGETQKDIVRQFNFLVDVHYKTKKRVSDYAEMLHKSSKTLSNLFNSCGAKTPQQIIHERVALEAKRFLLFTEKSCKEIAYSLGFEDAAHFSKFFKKMYEQTPLAYRHAQLSQEV